MNLFFCSECDLYFVSDNNSLTDSWSDSDQLDLDSDTDFDFDLKLKPEFLLESRL